jgi:polyisoprenyl-phosphate glycosyltransferase
MLSLIIPVYKNEANIPALLTAVQGIRDEADADFEAVFVVDGSPDRSFDVLGELLPSSGIDAQLVLLSRNFGSFAAIRAGLDQARGDHFVVMAADLQEPPTLALAMHRALAGDHCDVAYGERLTRHDGWRADMMSNAFWNFYQRFVARDMPKGGVDIFGCNRTVRDQILSLGERNSSLVGLLFWIGFRRLGFPYERAPREVGSSGWTFAKKWKYMQDSIFSFSNLPISLLLGLGFSGLILTILLSLVIFFSAIAGLITVPGYAATMLVILFLGMLQLLSIGVVGVYVWRIFDNTKGRPLHITMSVSRFGEEGPPP